MARVKSFDLPHKALRNLLSKFLLLAGNTEYSNAGQLLSLKKLGHELFRMLTEHTHIEDTITLTMLETRVKGSSVNDIKEHEELEAIQATLLKQLEAFDGTQSSDETHQFYLDYSNFYGFYLQHIYKEETVTEKLLHDNFTDDELNDLRMQIIKQMSFPILLFWLKYAIPAQNEETNLALLTGFSNAPKEAFETILSAINAEMPAERYNSLISKLKY